MLYLSNSFIHNVIAKQSGNTDWKSATTVYDFTVKDLDGNDVSLDKYRYCLDLLCLFFPFVSHLFQEVYCLMTHTSVCFVLTPFHVLSSTTETAELLHIRGHPLIIVNVASKCGFTKSNYQQLNDLYSKYKDQGLRILGFPCSQFMNQEPGCSVDIKEFIKKNKVEWDVFEKINVNGNDAAPLYQFLKAKQGGFLMNAIKWNFTKFLINKEGIPVSRHSPSTEPKDIETQIAALI